MGVIFARSALHGAQSSFMAHVFVASEAMRRDGTPRCEGEMASGGHGHHCATLHDVPTGLGSLFVGCTNVCNEA
jgi:hypothetical protein